MLELNGYFWHDLILIFQVSQKQPKDTFVREICTWPLSGWSLQAVLGQTWCCLTGTSAGERGGAAGCYQMGMWVPGSKGLHGIFGDSWMLPARLELVHISNQFRNHFPKAILVTHSPCYQSRIQSVCMG